MKAPFSRILPLLTTVFIDSLGFSLVFPIFSPMLINNEAALFSRETSLAMRGLVLGVLISTFCVGHFFGSPLLGGLSDRMGRRKVLIGSMYGAFIGYILSAIGVALLSLSLLFISRLFSGVAAASYAVAQSCIVDISNEKEKSKNFGLLGMAWGLGFILGPYIGGKCAAIDFSLPFLASALFCLANAGLLTLLFPETLAKVVPTRINYFAGIYQLKRAFKSPNLRGIFLVMFPYFLGWGYFTEFSPVYLSRQLGFSVSHIANFYAWTGLWLALCQGVLIRPFLKKFSPHVLLPVALLALALVLPVILLIKGLVSLFWILPVVALIQAFIMPTAATLVSEAGSKESQGEVMGIYSSVQWAAIGVSPFFSGSLVALYPHLPITIASGCMFIATSFYAYRFYRKRAEETLEG